MSLLVYGIVEAGDVEPAGAGLGDQPLHGLADQPLHGLADQPLHGLAEGPLMAIVSDHDGAPPDPTAEALYVHERTVRRLMDLGTILPAQFGSVLADEKAVRELLRRRRKDLMARLASVRGAVEIGLRASWLDSADAVLGSRPPSGTSYLRKRLELRQSARRVASVLEPLTSLARGSRRSLAPRPDLPVLDAYLVDRGRVREFVAMVEQLDDGLDDVELVCTGPWPPYSFAEGAPV